MRRQCVSVQHYSELDAQELRTVRDFRSEVFYEDGKRPGFVDQMGVFRDVQEIDEVSFHLRVPDEFGSLQAYLRLTPPEYLARFQSGPHLRRWESLVTASFRSPLARPWEFGRVAVRRCVQRSGFGRKAMVAAAGAALRMGGDSLVAMSGMRDGQHLFYERLGFAVLPESAEYIAAYNDETCLVAAPVIHLLAEAQMD